MRALFLIVGALLAPSCVYPWCVGVACEPCPPDLTLTVTDATTHGLIDGVVTSAGACTRQPCALSPGVGEHALTIEAPGYRAEHLRVTILPSDQRQDVCCSCPVAPVEVGVALMPLL